jgi:hypothetical protein
MFLSLTLLNSSNHRYKERRTSKQQQSRQQLTFQF